MERCTIYAKLQTVGKIILWHQCNGLKPILVIGPKKAFKCSFNYFNDNKYKDLTQNGKSGFENQSFCVEHVFINGSERIFDQIKKILEKIQPAEYPNPL